jgi:nucleotide-binding universal stress UspA family protein
MRARQRRNPTGFKSILCAVDFSLQSYAALQAAAHVAHRSGARLTALYVEDPLIGAGAAASGYNVSLLRKSTLTQLDRLMDLVGRPEDEIAAAAAGAKADLIILALRRGHGIFGPRQGATTYRVLCSSPTPVLALPPGWESHGALARPLTTTAGIHRGAARRTSRPASRPRHAA